MDLIVTFVSWDDKTCDFNINVKQWGVAQKNLSEWGLMDQEEDVMKM